MSDEQYFLMANSTINEFLLFSNAFTTHKLRANAACFVATVFALAVLSLTAVIDCPSSLS